MSLRGGGCRHGGSGEVMPRLLLSLLVAAVAVAVSDDTAAQAPRLAGTVLYEGARLITSDGSAPVERSAFLVENGRFTRVGRQGEVQAPAGATRVDLTGKTVMPALVDAHSHIGYMKHLTSGPQNYTRENILDHMHRFAYFGIAASQAMGSDFGDLPFQIRDELGAGKDPDAARFLTAGRGLSPLEEISPGNMRHAAYVVTTVEGARADVQELAQRNVPLIKMWVDTRGGTIKTLTPDLYGAILDEAHLRGMRVAVHATALGDAKALLRAGIDVFGHMISDVDDELVGLFKQHPDTAILLALSAPRRIVSAPWLNPPHPLIRETVLPEQIKRLQDRLAAQTQQET
ncbi:MAG: Amidohydro-rel protein, partial [Acidobacteria bacterium]|nr:Amidohydro-rel protein [Acidobacteriota bacterium]